MHIIGDVSKVKKAGQKIETVKCGWIWGYSHQASRVLCFWIPTLGNVHFVCDLEVGNWAVPARYGPFINDVMTSLPLPRWHPQNNINIPSTSPEKLFLSSSQLNLPQSQTNLSNPHFPTSTFTMETAKVRHQPNSLYMPHIVD